MALLSVKSITKLFGGLTALDKFDLQVAAGEIVGIIGPNGSGKTTFFNVLTGMVEANAGEVYLEGVQDNLLARKTHEIIACGISRTFQPQKLPRSCIAKKPRSGGVWRRRGSDSNTFGRAASRPVPAVSPGHWIP